MASTDTVAAPHGLDLPVRCWASPASDSVLYVGDALDVLATIPPETVDCVWTDPPYKLSNGGITCVAGRMVSVDKGEWDRSEGLQVDHQFNHDWIAACKRVLKPTGTIWVSGTLHLYPSVGMALLENGFRLLNDIIWEKPNPPPNLGRRTFTHSTEVVLWASKAEKGSPHKYTFNYGVMRQENSGKQMQTVWDFPHQAATRSASGSIRRRSRLRSSRAACVPARTLEVWCWTRSPEREAQALPHWRKVGGSSALRLWRNTPTSLASG